MFIVKCSYSLSALFWRLDPLQWSLNRDYNKIILKNLREIDLFKCSTYIRQIFHIRASILITRYQFANFGLEFVLIGEAVEGGKYF